jgi:hypothetical protein
MFSVSDDNSQRRTVPVVTYGLLALRPARVELK